MANKVRLIATEEAWSIPEVAAELRHRSGAWADAWAGTRAGTRAGAYRAAAFKRAAGGKSDAGLRRLVFGLFFFLAIYSNSANSFPEYILPLYSNLNFPAPFLP